MVQNPMLKALIKKPGFDEIEKVVDSMMRNLELIEKKLSSSNV
jgi:hypothetical protein